MFCATLLVKIGLHKLKALEKTRNVSIHPIMGVGSKPFRGHLSPENAENFLHEYKGLATVTVQSAFRYDYQTEQVRDCIYLLNHSLPNDEPVNIEPAEERILQVIIKKFRSRYEHLIDFLAPLANSAPAYIPQRRAIKLQIGLFGYSRNVVAR